MADFKYEIVEHLGVLEESKTGWRKEINRISWNDRPAKIDIRDWSANHEKMGKGISLSDQAVAQLMAILNEKF